MEIVEKIQTLVKFSESSAKNTLILSGICLAIFCFITLGQRLIQNGSQTSIEIWIIGLLTGVIIVVIGIYKPTILDTIIPKSKETHYETNVDKTKYELSVITNDNEKYLKFDNKGNDNIQLRNNDKKVNTNIFKIVAENDNEYLLEYEVVDKGFFTDTVKQERSSLTKQ
jgi:hypothetical protein